MFGFHAAPLVAPDATITDSLATAVGVLGTERGLALIESLPKTAALIITESNGQPAIRTSRRFQRLPIAD